jgi:fructokinase
MNGQLPTYACIEAGGTKFNCAVIDQAGAILVETRIPTDAPNNTLPRVIEFFEHQKDEYSLAAIGIASFGPLN